MNRQYIGARYVPTFANPVEWDKLRGYEALTIVTYKGTSYTSKVPVPPGIELNDETYWVVTGNYNAQVEKYREETNKVANDLVALETSTNAKINAINSPTLRSMNTRKFVFVGDSYTQVPTPTTSFVGVCANILGLSNNQYHNIGVSGVDMNGFISEINDYNFGDDESITDVVITGGINDAHYDFNTTTLRTTIPLLLDKIKSKFTNAVIWAGWSGGGYYTNPTLVNTYPTFTYENVQNIKYLWDSLFSADNKVIYMSGLDEWCRLLVDTDIYTGGSGLHPTGFGISVLASNIANYLKGGGLVSGELTANTTLTLKLALNASLETNGGKIVMNKYGNYEEIYIPWRGVNLVSPITLSAADLLLFNYDLQIDVAHNTVANNTTTIISAPITYYRSGATTTPIVASAVYTFKGTNVYVKIPNQVSPVTDVVSVWTPDLRFLVPANAI